jgi:hypothetical protein
LSSSGLAVEVEDHHGLAALAVLDDGAKVAAGVGAELDRLAPSGA